MFLPRVLSTVFCLCLGLRLSFSSPQPEARDKAMSDLFDYLEKRLHKQSQDEAETDDSAQDSLEKRKELKLLPLPDLPELKLLPSTDLPELKLLPLPEEEDEEQDQADFGEVGEVLTREVLSPFQQRSFSTPKLAKKTKLTSAQIGVIMDMHSKERTLTRGNDMMALEWDNKLARLAQGLSDSCKWGHDNMKLPDGTKAGQNIAYHSNPEQPISYLVQMWIDEKNDYNIHTGACKSGKACGHYTQMVWSETTKVGCGATKCPMGLYLVCDYLKAGNMKGKKAVNLGGRPCSKCNLYPGTACTDGLCSVCNKGTAGCRPYDSSQCIDVKKDSNVGDCGWVKSGGLCEQSKYRTWLEGNCAKTCGYCRS